MKTLERVHITKAPINLIVSFARRGLGITPSPFEGFPPSLGPFEQLRTSFQI